ncbi:MAG: succinate dehydrogenase / fumarate reductase membrane anchor subunit [Granulosicoccus sp.]|jgi:succinate dehydrogenase / fumarate reductase membrane anchor subunit
MSFLTDYKRVAGLGSAKSGTGHFVQQRLTAIALIPLTVLFLYTFIGALGSGHDAVLETYSHPVPALVAIMFIWAVFSHLRLGLQVVIEDYVPNHRTQQLLLIANALIWRGTAIIGLFAIARIAL